MKVKLNCTAAVVSGVHSRLKYLLHSVHEFRKRMTTTGETSRSGQHFFSGNLAIELNMTRGRDDNFVTASSLNSHKFANSHVPEQVQFRCPRRFEQMLKEFDL
jgi:hypothetical protein